MKHKTKRFRLIKGKIVWSKTFAKISEINERKLAEIVAKRNSKIIADYLKKQRNEV